MLLSVKVKLPRLLFFKLLTVSADYPHDLFLFFRKGILDSLALV